MSRRGRAALFATAAAICAGLAAGASGGGEADLTAELGPLREVIVAAESLEAGTRLDLRSLRRRIDVRRVPQRFIPVGAISSPEMLAGRRLAAPVPAGGYVLDAMLREPGGGARRVPATPPGGRAVEIPVTGAATLAERSSPDQRVDVIVTSEPSAGGGAGRTYIAAASVPLLDLRPAHASAAGTPGPGVDSWLATLALSRDQAIRLLHAGAFARAVHLIAA